MAAVISFINTSSEDSLDLSIRSTLISLKDSLRSFHLLDNNDNISTDINTNSDIKIII